MSISQKISRIIVSAFFILSLVFVLPAGLDYSLTKIAGDESTVVKSLDTSVYAASKKSPKKYAVKFNANKGTVSKKSKKIKKGSKYGKLPTPKKSNYRFTGWYTKKSGGKKITANTKVTKAKKHTLYAHWTKALKENTTVINRIGKKAGDIKALYPSFTYLGYDAGAQFWNGSTAKYYSYGFQDYGKDTLPNNEKCLAIVAEAKYIVKNFNSTIGAKSFAQKLGGKNIEISYDEHDSKKVLYFEKGKNAWFVDLKKGDKVAPSCYIKIKRK